MLNRNLPLFASSTYNPLLFSYSIFSICYFYIHHHVLLKHRCPPQGLPSFLQDTRLPIKATGLKAKNKHQQHNLQKRKVRSSTSTPAWGWSPSASSLSLAPHPPQRPRTATQDKPACPATRPSPDPLSDPPAFDPGPISSFWGSFPTAAPAPGSLPQQGWGHIEALGAAPAASLPSPPKTELNLRALFSESQEGPRRVSLGSLSFSCIPPFVLRGSHCKWSPGPRMSQISNQHIF